MCLCATNVAWKNATLPFHSTVLSPAAAVPDTGVRRSYKRLPGESKCYLLPLLPGPSSSSRHANTSSMPSPRMRCSCLVHACDQPPHQRLNPTLHKLPQQTVLTSGRRAAATPSSRAGARSTATRPWRRSKSEWVRRRGAGVDGESKSSCWPCHLLAAHALPCSPPAFQGAVG